MHLALKTYRTDLGWSLTQLSRKAGVARAAVKNAEDGNPIRAETAKAIADALSKGMGVEIKVSNIAGLNIL